ncbi:MAG: hypothetical protein PHV97_08240 [Candidatus Omnitrophica bacterium]|nr:hypothetical protein [Candidatus Omnitrophota bacterium]
MERKIKGFQKKPRKNARGFTLVEITMAVVFFSLLSLAIFSTVSSASNIMQMQSLHASINQGGTQMLRSIAREIAESSPVADQSHLVLPIPADANGNSIVTFQVPVDWDSDNDVVQSTLTQSVEWGARPFVNTPSSQSWNGLNGWIRYRVENNQLLREILTASNGSVLATDIIIPGNVSAFQVTQTSTRRYTLLLTLSKTDAVNQKGATARTYQTTFDGDVLLRNGG